MNLEDFVDDTQYPVSYSRTEFLKRKRRTVINERILYGFLILLVAGFGLGMIVVAIFDSIKYTFEFIFTGLLLILITAPLIQHWFNLDKLPDYCYNNDEGF